MIDTLRICHRDVRIARNAPIMILCGAVNYSTGEVCNEKPLFHWSDGSPALGKSAYYNSQYANISFHNGHAFVQFSIAKIAGKGDNTRLCNKNEAFDLLDKVYGDLAEKGIILNWREGQLSRVDTFLDIATDYPIQSYFQLFEKLNGKRMPNRVKYGSQTYRFQNTVKEIEIYDKSQEILNRGGVMPEELPKNCMRVEFRVMKGSDCAKVYAVPNVLQLLNKWDDIPSICKTNIKKILLPFEPRLSLVQMDKDEQMRAFHQEYGRNGLDSFIKYLGASAIIEMYGTADGFIDSVARNFDKDKKTTRYAYNSLLERVFHHPCGTKQDMGLSGLYDEIRTKIKAA